MNTADIIEPALVHEDGTSESPVEVERKFFVANLGELQKRKVGPHKI